MLTGWKEVDAGVAIVPREAGVGALLASVLIAVAGIYGATGRWI